MKKYRNKFQKLTKRFAVKEIEKLHKNTNISYKDIKNIIKLPVYMGISVYGR